MGVGIPSHLRSDYSLSLVRPAGGGLSAWSSPKADTAPYWTGLGYASLALAAQHRAEGSAEQRGTVLFYLDPPPVGGEVPKASDLLVLDGEHAEVLSVRPPNRLIDYWKIEVRTGPA